jgi:membrane-bound ClpP family serine protease
MVAEGAEPQERPFALVGFAVLDAGAGVLLVIAGASRLAVEGSSPSVLAALAAGALAVVVGVALVLGARWAYRVMQVLVPAAFLSSIAATLVIDEAFLAFVLMFGAATLVLYGSRRFFAGTRAQLAEWFARRPVDGDVHRLPRDQTGAGGELAA